MDVSGYYAFANDLRGASLRAVRMAGVATAKTAADIERDAKINAPVDTGTLRSSISYVLSQGNLHAEIGPTVNYAHFLEFGTSRMRAQPFLFPATDRHMPAYEAALAQVVTL